MALSEGKEDLPAAKLSSITCSLSLRSVCQ